MPKWKFVHAKGLKVQGMNHSGEDRFSDNKYQSLAREVIQNSLDARNKKLASDSPVKVEFSLMKIENDEFPEVSYIRDEVIPKAQGFSKWKSNEDTKEYLSEMIDALNTPKISVLRISDFGTTGLNENQYESIIGEGYSVKVDDDSQGSKGIGKAAPFVNSIFRTVFYNSKSTDFEDNSVGIMHFLSFPINENDESDITEPEGKFVESEYNRIRKQTVFGDYVRNDFGTDLFIMGFDEDEGEWENHLILSILYNFFISIYQEKLVVSVGDLVINKASLSDVIDYFGNQDLSGDLKRQYDETRRYFKVLATKEGEEKKTFPLDSKFVELFPEFIESENDGTLMIIRDDEGTRRVLQTRSSGMRIFARSRIVPNIPYTAIFQATGSKFNRFLKDMESAAHNNWSKDQKTVKKGSKIKAASLLAELGKYFREHIAEEFGVTGEDGVKAFALGEFLSNEEKNGKKTVDDSGIIKNLTNITLRDQNRKISQASTNEKEVKRKSSDSGYDGEHGSGSQNRNGDNQTKESGGGSNQGNGDGPHTGNNKGGDGNHKKNQIKWSHNRDFKAKILETDYTAGIYDLVILPEKNASELNLSLKTIGADGRSDSLLILEVYSSTSHEIDRNQHYLKLFNINKGERISIKFKINSKMRVRMEVDINANER